MFVNIFLSLIFGILTKIAYFFIIVLFETSIQNLKQIRPWLPLINCLVWLKIDKIGAFLVKKSKFANESLLGQLPDFKLLDIQNEASQFQKTFPKH